MRRLNNQDLINALVPYAQNTPLLDLIANSLGYLSFSELAKENSGTLQSFLLEATEDLFTLWLLEKNRVILFQTTRTAQTLSVSIPLSRVRRVVSEVDSTTYKITIEIDADRLLINSTSTTNDQLDESQGTVLYASYSLNGLLVNYPQILPFYTSINNLIH